MEKSSQLNQLEQNKKELVGELSDLNSQLKNSEEFLNQDNNTGIYKLIIVFITIIACAMVAYALGMSPLFSLLFLVIIIISSLVYRNRNEAQMETKHVENHFAKIKIAQIEFKLQDLNIKISTEKNKPREKLKNFLLPLQPYLEKQMQTIGIDLNILKADLVSSYNISYGKTEIEEVLFSLSWSSVLNKRPGTSILYLTKDLRNLSSVLKLNDFVEELDEKFEEWESRSYLEKKEE